ncbi:hypothetical protein ACIOUG_22550 [Pseudomonas sp. NPDC087803]|uniref:hypothetical protein n=1 Tax=Pseudomonas sp. NPDC087803 TaxID=3364448 RepID=UPI0037F5BDD8
MPGSYIWKGASIWHKVGCTCSSDPNYVICGCQGAGGYFAGPENPTEYTLLLAAAEEKRKKEEQEAADLAEVNAAEQHKKNLDAIAFLDAPKDFKKENRDKVANVAERLEYYKTKYGTKPSSWSDLISKTNIFGFKQI